jgi:hypothetical protein
LNLTAAIWSGSFGILCGLFRRLLDIVGIFSDFFGLFWTFLYAFFDGKIAKYTISIARNATFHISRRMPKDEKCGVHPARRASIGLARAIWRAGPRPKSMPTVQETSPRATAYQEMIVGNCPYCEIPQASAWPGSMPAAPPKAEISRVGGAV